MKDLALHVQSKLPTKRPIDLRCEADYYGIARHLANRLGYVDAPVSQVAWQHGWGFGPITDPREIIGEETHRDAFFVSNQSIAAFLQIHGFNAIATGLPLVYVDDLETPVERLSNSLLVMPAHTSKQSKHSIDELDYVNRIAEMAASFDHVLVCVSQQCFDKGYWVESFREIGIDSIIGAGIDDGNALLRMRRLLSQFEVMTSNAIGSHFVYAGHCGCRLSLTEPFHRIIKADIAAAPFYQANPELLDCVMNRTSKESIEAHFPHLLAEPINAKTAKEWADREIGVDCRLTDKRIASLMQWPWWHRIAGKTKRSIRKRFKRHSGNSLQIQKAA